MKTLRKNIDLDTATVAILQIEATLKGYGSLKPFIEKIVVDFAAKSSRERPDIYKKVVERKMAAVCKKAKPKVLPRR
jgi:hypothetical protein